jgi:CDP-glucose 4,6-dehydratase
MLKKFKNKTVLITGHTGFKGSWLCAWLNLLGAKVVGLSIDIPSKPSLFSSSMLGSMVEDHRLDIRNAVAIKQLVNKIQPDFVFHLAAQALVRRSYEDPLETISTNALGTATILDAIRELDKKVVAVLITSDKVYDNVEWAWGYREVDKIGGKDPYSASKGMAELAIRSYIECFFKRPDSNVKIGIARAGNVIGGGDWALDRIVPDCMRAWSKNELVEIRSPKSTRPWQHVLEPLSGYLTLALNLDKNSDNHGEAYNFGPPADQNYLVEELIFEMSKYWEKIKWNDVSNNSSHLHEAGLLKLNCDKALLELNWTPNLRFEETVKMTVEWYKEFYNNDGDKMHSFTISQIEEYSRLAQNRDKCWI